MSRLKIRVRKPWIAYPGSTIQQNYAEDLEHGYLLWSIKGSREHDVSFRRLPNPRPFITIEWVGSISDTLAAASLVMGARYRVRSREHMSQSDMDQLTSELKSSYKALEVTYKAEQQLSNDLVAAGDMRVVKDDLRNPDVLMKLIRNHYNDAKLDEAAWESINELVRSLLKLAGDGDVTRNVEWSLRHLKYDNLFAFGDGNEMNFDAALGITGVFGPNRIGKSSIVGTIMYSLFNATDRGSIANVHVVNTRKSYGFSRAVINVNGTDYVIERQTTKYENKKGEVNAPTQLNLFRIEQSGEAVDLNGEQRSDTEQTIRKLIGTGDDFMLTSAATQGDINRFISEGSTQRKKILARYLDLDLFDRMYKLANDEVNALKAQLKEVPERDWNKLLADELAAIELCHVRAADVAGRLESAHSELDALKVRAAKHSDTTPVTSSQVNAFEARVEKLRAVVRSSSDEHDEIERSIAEIKERLTKIDEVVKQVDLSQLRHLLDDHRELEAAVTVLKHQHEREQALLRQQERTLRILDEVPCGDSFPKCKFIKDAHSAKTVISSQRVTVESALLQLQRSQEALAKRQIDELKERISKCEKLIELASRLRGEEGTKIAAHARVEARLAQQVNELRIEEERLKGLREALENDENEELVSIRRLLDDVRGKIKGLDNERLAFATEQGRRQANVEKLKREQHRFAELQAKMKVYDQVANALSKRGVPNLIVSSQLPLINAEIARILHGIVDFTVELQGDVESNAMDVFINYGDSRRIIELASGMEKMLSSIAIRVALRSVSSLPKTNMLIIDEGFGTLDDAAVEACNRLLASLKRTFKNVIVITHVDGIKDIADNLIEITRVEKDSRVIYR